MRPRPAERVVPWAWGVFALTFFAFLPTLSNGWVDFDDAAFILKNRNLYPLSLENIRWMLTAVYGGHFHPLTWLSLALNLAVFGTPAWSFHLVDLLLHCGSAVLLFFIAKRLLGSLPGAAAAALFFSVHPLRVESVAWAIERRDVLSGFFYLAAVLLHLKAIDEPGKSWRRLSWLSFALSLLSKGAGITLPLALTVLDYYPLQRDWRKNLGEKIPYWLMALGAAALAFAAERENGSALGLGQYALGLRLQTAGFGFLFYIARTLAPLHLIPLYEMPPKPGLWLSPLPLTALALVFAALGLSRKPKPGLSALAFYALTIAPMLGLVRFGPQAAADRYSYLATISFAVLFGALASRKSLAPACAAVLLLLGGLTWRQTSFWRDPVTLWTHALEVDPDIAMGQQHLAYALAGEGRFSLAVPHYDRAVQLKPDYWLAWNNLGWSLAQLGKLDEARAAYLKAIEFKPDYWEARSNLGLTLARQNNLGEAEDQFLEALKFAPAEPGLHSNLGLVYYAQKKPKEASAEFMKALMLDPRQPQARMMLNKIGRP